MSEQVGMEEARWATEAAFFDEVAASEPIALTPTTIQRYSNPPLNSPYPMEYQFARLGDVRGKRILEIGCGTGGSSVLLALRGAKVTGVDISPGSIDLARQRADHHGVGSQIEFICSPFEKLQAEGGRFDIIWIEAFLHHLPDKLDEVFRTLRGIAGPDALLIAREPVNMTGLVKTLRKVVPIKKEATPDERPLEPRDFDRFAPLVSDFHPRYFAFLSRFERVLWDDSPIGKRFPNGVKRTRRLFYQIDASAPQALMRNIGGVIVFDCRLK